MRAIIFFFPLFLLGVSTASAQVVLPDSIHNGYFSFKLGIETFIIDPRNDTAYASTVNIERSGGPFLLSSDSSKFVSSEFGYSMHFDCGPGLIDVDATLDLSRKIFASLKCHYSDHHPPYERRGLSFELKNVSFLITTDSCIIVSVGAHKLNGFLTSLDYYYSHDDPVYPAKSESGSRLIAGGEGFTITFGQQFNGPLNTVVEVRRNNFTEGSNQLLTGKALRIPAAQFPRNLLIFDLMGRLMASEQVPANVSRVELPSLSAGVYRVVCGEEVMKILKM